MKNIITRMSKFLEKFCEEYKEWEKRYTLIDKRRRRRESRMSLKDMLLVVIIFHISGFYAFKHYYLFGVQGLYKKWFGNTLSYARFIYFKCEFWIRKYIIK